MTSSLKLVALAVVLAIPFAVAASVILLRRSRRQSPLRREPSIVRQTVGAVLGQGFGLALFAVAASYRAFAQVEIVNGVVGYGTLLFSPWAGIGTWGLATALGERAAHPVRALLMSCGFALGAVLVFFGSAAAFKFDGEPWMVVYALSPVVGALVGYRLGAFGISMGLLEKSRRLEADKK